jgi:tellurite resistance protein
MDRSELFPLFTDLHMSADEATAIAAALRDIAEVDGTHPEEQEMIDSLVHEIGVELGDAPKLPRITPKELATKLVTPELRTAALQAAVLLAMADGTISEPERRRILEYATALGVNTADYARLEATIAGWVRSGDAGPLFS